jgi:hypothetical protein
MDPIPIVDPHCSIKIFVLTDPFHVYHVIARTRKFSALYYRADPYLFKAWYCAGP